MKRKLPILIAILLTLAIALAACQSQISLPTTGANQADPLPSHVDAPAETTQPTEPVDAQPQPEEPKLVTKEEAISAALAHAGLKRSQVSHLQAELDKDDGRTVYEVDFETATWEYEYEIHAETGKILSWDKEWDD